MEKPEEPRTSAIASIGKNRELGGGNKLLWKLDADFERMKRITKGHALIMGRKTYESIGRELPHSPSVVIVRETSYSSPYKNAQHTTIVHSIEEAFEKASELEQVNEEKEIFIFGGASIYKATAELVDRWYLTEIDATDERADAFLPDIGNFTKVLEETQHEENGVHFRLLTLEREK